MHIEVSQKVGKIQKLDAFWAFGHLESSWLV